MRWHGIPLINHQRVGWTELHTPEEPLRVPETGTHDEARGVAKPSFQFEGIRRSI
jgi:hypothetical protein